MVECFVESRVPFTAFGLSCAGIVMEGIAVGIGKDLEEEDSDLVRE
jgi:hypothetical protein